MDTTKTSNLHSYLKEKYGFESVRLLQNWECIIKKTADIQNHRRFTLRCIKVGITQVTCRLKDPMKTPKVITLSTNLRSSYYTKE